MEIVKNESYAITSVDIIGINCKEMQQMDALKSRIAHVIDTHKHDDKKNEYLTDDELLMMHAILHVFTREYSNSNNSAFDDALKELKNS